MSFSHTIGLGLWASKYKSANGFEGKGKKSLLCVRICAKSSTSEPGWIAYTMIVQQTTSYFDNFDKLH